jgi:predicted RecB family nuclease
VWVDFSHGDPSINDDYRIVLAATEEAVLTGSLQPTIPLHSPWWRTECSRCDWADFCANQLIARDDVTLLTLVNSDIREVLASDYITTIHQVAALDVDDVRLPDTSVVLQARARTANRLLRRDAHDGALAVPTARREVDFDIETYDGEIYLAGFLVTQDGTSSFEPVVNWAGTARGEAEVVSEMFAKLASLADEDTVVLHWTDYERRTLAAAGERHGLSIPGSGSVDEWFDHHAVDLCAWTRNTLVSPSGFGLKTVARLCGFEWRDDDPGGRQSEIWFEKVIAGDDAMKERLLAYNEDDVVAQREIRRWIRSEDSGAGPGSAIPSVHSGVWR